MYLNKNKKIEKSNEEMRKDLAVKSESDSHEKSNPESNDGGRRNFLYLLPGALISFFLGKKVYAATWKKLTATTAASTWTATQTLAGTSNNIAAILTNAAEVVTVSATASTGTVPFYTSTQSVLYYTSAATANWTMNLTHASGVSFNSILAVGQCVTLAFMATQGATAYYNSSVQVDGTTTGVTTKWQGGTAPTSGNTNSIDVYTYTIIKTAASTFTVLASQSKFA